MCNITFGPAYRVGNELRVAGTVVGCLQDADSQGSLRVAITCNGETATDFPSVDLAGNWYARVPAGNCNCQVGAEQLVTITATCLSPIDPAGCLPVSAEGPLVCIDDCIGLTFGPGADDAGFLVDASFVCKGGPSPNAIITFTFWVENTLPFAAFVNVTNPIIVAVNPAVPLLVPAGALQQVVLEVEVPTPLNISNDTFFFTYQDAEGRLIPCPGFSEIVRIGGSCCPLLPVPPLTTSVDNCQLTVSWDPALVPPGCWIQFDFRDPAAPATAFSLTGTSLIRHDYAAAGTYTNLTAFINCTEGCAGNPEVFGPVEITDCDGDGIITPPAEPESTACQGTRIAAVVAGGMFLFLEALAICRGNAALAKYALIVGGIAAVLWLIYFLFGCNKPCGFTRLTAAETLIAAGLALLVYSACCQLTFLLTGAAFLFVGGMLFRQWVRKCKVSKCEAAAELAGLGIFVSSYLLVFLDLFPGVAPCKATLVALNGFKVQGDHVISFLTAIPVAVLIECIRGAAPDDGVVSSR